MPQFADETARWSRSGGGAARAGVKDQQDLAVIAVGTVAT